MSNTYLDKFRSSLPSTQGNQILKLLIKKRDSGEIKNIDEFKNKLRALTTDLLAKRITPTLKLFEAVAGVDTSSEQFNEMLDRIHDDLEAAFVEADNIDEIVAAHQNLINNVSLKAMRYGINELESKINLYEFLNKNDKGFDDAIFNTFRESLNHITSRSEQAASISYFDPRTRLAIPSTEDTETDYIGERLILGSSQKNYLPVRDVVWLSNANSIRSELDVSFKNSNINNIIDNKNSTYWIQPILLKEIRGAGVPMEICLYMSASQDINFIEIEPAAPFPIILTGIDYYDSNNTRQTVSSTSLTLEGPRKIFFEYITTKCVILKLRQDNYTESQFNFKPGTSNFARAVLGQSLSTVDIPSISDDLRDLLSSDFILNSIIGVGAATYQPVKYYEYILGLDNVRLGFSLFNDRGIYVSEKKRVSQLGQVALRVDETRPTQVDGSTSISLESFKYPARTTVEDANFYHGTVEYWLLTQSFTSAGFLISTDTIPLLPLGASRVYHERVIFKGKTPSAVNPNVAQLIFFTDDDETDVCVYRNGTKLTYGTTSTDDWEFVASDDPDVGSYTLATPNAGKPMKRAIWIKDTVRPLDIYTVSYTPMLSNTQVNPTSTNFSLMRTVDLLGDQSTRITTDNVVLFDKTRLAYDVAYTDIYFMVIMRRNSAKQNLSPALEEYMVITSSRDTQKYIGD